MNQQRRGRKIITLSILVVLGIAYSSLFYSQHTLTGMNNLDGIIGVVLGLYICSLPAANAVDMLFAERGAFRQLSPHWTGGRWLALNLLTLLVGWIVIVIGAIRLFR